MSQPSSLVLALGDIIDQTGRVEHEALVIEGELEEGGGGKCSDYLVRWRALLFDLPTHISERATSRLLCILHYFCLLIINLLLICSDQCSQQHITCSQHWEVEATLFRRQQGDYLYLSVASIFEAKPSMCRRPFVNSFITLSTLTPLFHPCKVTLCTCRLNLWLLFTCPHYFKCKMGVCGHMFTQVKPAFHTAPQVDFNNKTLLHRCNDNPFCQHSRLLLSGQSNAIKWSIIFYM